MLGIGLLYEADGVSLDLGSLREGVAEDMQNAVVNVMTAEGSDIGFPKRGTTLSRRAMAGAITDTNGARHAANFAALSTAQFMRLQNPAPGFTDLRMKPVRFDEFRLVVELIALDSKGDPVVFTTKF